MNVTASLQTFRRPRTAVWLGVVACLVAATMLTTPSAQADETVATVSINSTPVHMDNDIGSLIVSAAPKNVGDPNSYYCNLQISLRVSPLIASDASMTEVDMTAKINGKKTDWNYTKLEGSRYGFHTKLGKYQNKGDGPFTKHGLHRGDVVVIDIITQSSDGADNVTGVSTETVSIV